MPKKIFTKEDIDNDMLEYADCFFRTVIMNIKRNYLRRLNRSKKHGISFTDIEQMKYDYADKSDLTLEIYYSFTVEGVEIPIYNIELAEAINQLPELQRMVLLKHIVLGVPLCTIADELNISYPTVRRYERRALKFIKEQMEEVL